MENSRLLRVVGRFLGIGDCGNLFSVKVGSVTEIKNDIVLECVYYVVCTRVVPHSSNSTCLIV